jgi:hypothetical protein
MSKNRSASAVILDAPPASPTKRLARVAELLKRERARRANDPNPANQFQPDAKREIEALLGRPLKVSEDLHVRLEGRNLVTIRDRIRSSGWAPPMASEEVDFLDAEISRVEDEIKQEKLARMTPKERELWMLKETKKQVAMQAAREQQEAAERAARQPILEKLQELYDTYSDNPWFAPEHLESVAKAMLAVETPGSDLDAAQQLIDEAQRPKQQYAAEVRGRLQNQIQEWTGELVEFEQEHQIQVVDPEISQRKPWLGDPRFVVGPKDEAQRQRNLAVVAEYKRGQVQ